MKYPEGPNPSKSEDANDRGYAERRVVDVNVEKIFKPQTPDSRLQAPECGCRAYHGIDVSTYRTRCKV